MSTLRQSSRLLATALASGVLLLQGCAVMDRTVPAWDEFRTPDATDAPAIALHAESRGTGDAVLLIHGFGASSYSWRYVVDSLARQHRVITIDLKGSGQSPKPRDDDYSVYEQARLVRDHVLANGFDNLQIVGHSYGGAVAIATSLYLAESNPGLQDSLVLIDSMAYPQQLPFFIELLATPVLGPLAIGLTPERFQVRQLLELVYYDDTLVPADAVEHYAELLEEPGAKYALLQTARQILPADMEAFSAQYATLTLPTLILWGSEDAIIPLTIGQRLDADLPDSTLKVFDNTGHAVQEEAPQQLIPVLQEFLNRQRPDLQ